ncbi:MAG: tyrosine-type recombinase/integrase [Chitinophagaceae bacterium]
MPVVNTLVIQPFLDAIKYEKRYSYHTIRAYHDDLIQFFDYFSFQFGLLEISQVTPPIVRSWLASLKDTGLSGKSISRKLSTLRSFFRYQMRTGAMETSPVLNITPPKIPKRLPAYIEQEDMVTLLKQVEFPDTWNGMTDKLLIRIFYHTGIRLNELVLLKELQIDAGNNTLKVLGKGNKERIIPVSNELINGINEYRAAKRSRFSEVDVVYLLVNKSGKKLYHKYVYLAVKKYLKKITTIDKKSPHVLRHTFATHLTNNGAGINAVKELLGHASLAATQIYTHNNIEKLKEIHKKAHPKS